MELSKILNRYRHLLLQKPNVVGVGRGKKTVRGEKTEEEAVIVLVSKKLPDTDLKRSAKVPLNIEKVKTDVLEVGEIRLLQNNPRTNYKRPAQPGMSIGHYKITAGTFGAVVYDKKTGKPLILSNNHVLANITNGRDGRSQKGDPILQPGSYDGGTSDQVIGHLERFVPIELDYQNSQCPKAANVARTANSFLHLLRPDYNLHFQKKALSPNFVDAAVAVPVKEDFINPEILEIGLVKGTTAAAIGSWVQKSGRTSGYNKATVEVLEASIQVMMGENEPATFANQIVTGPLAQPGDSGSLILDMSNKAVGLLFAGSDQATIINPIQAVLDALDLTF